MGFSCRLVCKKENRRLHFLLVHGQFSQAVPTFDHFFKVIGRRPQISLKLLELTPLYTSCSI